MPKEIHLISRPDSIPAMENFAVIEKDYEVKYGQIKVQNIFISVDPYMRGRMRDVKSYVPPFALFAPMEGHAIGRVLESKVKGFKTGDIVTHMLGWREIAVAEAKHFTKISPKGLPLEAFLGPLGMTGFTAWSGLTQIGEPKAGETIFVSGAAGAVGSIVVQIAKILGCKVVASVGSDDKVEFIKKLGADVAFNYKKSTNLTKSLAEAAPQGIDIYFDNVGGDHLAAALNCANFNARFIECGMIESYNYKDSGNKVNNLILIIGKSLKLQGFIVSKYQHLSNEFSKQMAGWIKSGLINWQQTVYEGIENTPKAFIGLFEGANTGKMLVKISD